MKIHWSAIYLLLLLSVISCGSEQFGTVQQKESTQVDSLKSLEQVSCSNHTLIKPKVDIVYFIDNSESTREIQSEIKQAIINTVNSVSQQFDYRLVSTHLVDSSHSHPDYDSLQILTNSQDSLNTRYSSKKILSSTELNAFNSTTAGNNENGLARVHGFITENAKYDLFRKGAYLLVVLISNGRDASIETMDGGGYYENVSVYNEHKKKILSLKTLLNNQQFRFMSVVTHKGCTKQGWLPATNSYIKMSREIYEAQELTDQAGNPTKDSYNLCANGLNTIFTAVNNSIQQVIVPHKYKYWPITFSTFDPSKIKVIKSSPTMAPVEMSADSWTYEANASKASIDTRIAPTPGEPSTLPMVKFTDGNEIIYPECVSIKSTTNMEYFGYIVLPKAPVESSIVLKIKGRAITQSSTDGWQYVGHKFDQNIKVQNNGYSDLPAVLRSGYMIKLNGSANFYESGDSVEIYYLPAPL